MDATTVVPMSESNLGRLRQMVAVISAFVVQPALEMEGQRSIRPTG